MPDPSPNVPVSDRPPLSFTPPSVQLVYREPIELFKLEQQLAASDSPERQHTILSLLIARLLGQGLNVPAPPVADPSYREWEEDMKELHRIDEKFQQVKRPSPDFPRVAPLTGKAIPEYDIMLDGDLPVATVFGSDLSGFLEVFMRHRLQASFQAAARPMWRWLASIHRILARWRVWDMTTEFNAGLSDVSDSDIDKKIEAGNRQAAALYGEGAPKRPRYSDDEEEDEGDIDDSDDPNYR